MSRKFVQFCVACAAAALGFTACSKKEAEAPAPPTAQAVPAENQPQQPSPDPLAAGPTAADLAAQQAAMERLRQAELAARQKEYEQAVEAMLAIQQQRRALTEQQAQLYYERMRQLQADLAAGIAAGDPRAKAAAERLRRAATVR
ncbi:MAG: hypothetical protein WHT82_02680 [Limisphaera sp.]